MTELQVGAGAGEAAGGTFWKLRVIGWPNKTLPFWLFASSIMDIRSVT